MFTQLSYDKAAISPGNGGGREGDQDHRTGPSKEDTALDLGCPEGVTMLIGGAECLGQDKVVIHDLHLDCGRNTSPPWGTDMAHVLTHTWYTLRMSSWVLSISKTWNGMPWKSSTVGRTEQ